MRHMRGCWIVVIVLASCGAKHPPECERAFAIASRCMPEVVGTSGRHRADYLKNCTRIVEDDLDDDPAKAVTQRQLRVQLKCLAAATTCEAVAACPVL
jgi:hypothetical protein